jgi:sec-independent protein translocase protein TatB
MFDVGWSEMVVIGVVALVAIGPKELPGVLRTAGQMIGKARRMAAELQGQFQEALREADVADLKKQFDEVKSAATQMTGGNVLTSLQQDVSDALKIDTPAAATPTTPEPPTPETLIEATIHDASMPESAPATPSLEAGHTSLPDTASTALPKREDHMPAASDKAS